MSLTARILHVIDIVESCARYRGGVESPLEAVRRFERAAFAMEALDALIAGRQRRS